MRFEKLLLRLRVVGAGQQVEVGLQIGRIEYGVRLQIVHPIGHRLRCAQQQGVMVG